MHANVVILVIFKCQFHVNDGMESHLSYGRAFFLPLAIINQEILLFFFFIVGLWVFVDAASQPFSGCVKVSSL